MDKVTVQTYDFKSSVRVTMFLSDDGIVGIRFEPTGDTNKWQQLRATAIGETPGDMVVDIVLPVKEFE